MADVDNLDALSNAELRTQMIAQGLPNIPVTDSSRKVLVKRLRASIGGNAASPSAAASPKKAAARRETLQPAAAAATTAAVDKPDAGVSKARRTIAATFSDNKEAAGRRKLETVPATATVAAPTQPRAEKLVAAAKSSASAAAKTAPIQTRRASNTERELIPERVLKKPETKKPERIVEEPAATASSTRRNPENNLLVNSLIILESDEEEDEQMTQAAQHAERQYGLKSKPVEQQFQPTQKSTQSKLSATNLSTHEYISKPQEQTKPAYASQQQTKPTYASQQQSQTAYASQQQSQAAYASHQQSQTAYASHQQSQTAYASQEQSRPLYTSSQQSKSLYPTLEQQRQPQQPTQRRNLIYDASSQSHAGTSSARTNPVSLSSFDVRSGRYSSYASTSAQSYAYGAGATASTSTAAAAQSYRRSPPPRTYANEFSDDTAEEEDAPPANKFESDFARKLAMLRSERIGDRSSPFNRRTVADTGYTTNAAYEPAARRSLRSEQQVNASVAFMRLFRSLDRQYNLKSKIYILLVVLLLYVIYKLYY